MKCGFWGQWPRAAEAARREPGVPERPGGGARSPAGRPVRCLRFLRITLEGGRSGSQERPSCCAASVSSPSAPFLTLQDLSWLVSRKCRDGCSRLRVGEGKSRETPPKRCCSAISAETGRQSPRRTFSDMNDLGKKHIMLLSSWCLLCRWWRKDSLDVPAFFGGVGWGAVSFDLCRVCSGFFTDCRTAAVLA